MNGIAEIPFQFESEYEAAIEDPARRKLGFARDKKPNLPYQSFRRSRSPKNTVFASGSFGKSGTALRNSRITLGL